VPEGQALTVRVEHFHFEGNLELEVYHPCDTRVGFSYNAGPNYEEVVIENTEAGMYCARIFGRSGIVENGYTISVTLVD
jgi:hypothetical protein